MTNEITASKAEFALDLQNASLDVVDYVPERIVPPIIVISADSTYLTQESLGMDYRLGLKLTLVAGTATNETVTDELDDLIAKTVHAMGSLGYVILKSVQQPYRLQVNNAEYYAADLSCDLSITL
mgnify:CR=1 FL=1